MTESLTAKRPIRAPHGTAISCKGWQQEGALRLLLNSLDPEVADRPEELIIHGTAKPAHDWEAFQSIASTLRTLEIDETLNIEAGKPSNLSRSSEDSPRVIIELTASRTPAALRSPWFPAPAAGWTYVGSQSILPSAYELFSVAALRHFGGTLAGRLVVSGGMGGIGGAQPLAASFCAAAFLSIEVDPERIKRRVKTGYCEVMVNDLDEALRILKNAVRKKEPASAALIGNCADVIPELARRGVVPDILTDHTSADNPDGGYIPLGISVQQAPQLFAEDPAAYRQRALASMTAHARGLLALQKLGSVVIDWDGSIAAVAQGLDASSTPRTPVPASTYLHSHLEEGAAVVTLIALSGEPADIARAERFLIELFPADERLGKWIAFAATHVRFQGLPARTCWLTSRQAARLISIINERVASGELHGPMVLAGAINLARTPAWIWKEKQETIGKSWVLDGTAR